MTDETPTPDPYADAGDEDDLGPNRESTSSPPGAPRWVKVSGIIALVLVLLLVILQVTGLGGEHGPGRHGDDTPAGQIPPAGGDAPAGHTGPPPGFEHGEQQP